MTCRVCSSFLRVGHLELFARRAREAWNNAGSTELQELVIHAMRREYPEPWGGIWMAVMAPMVAVCFFLFWDAVVTVSMKGRMWSKMM